MDNLASRIQGLVTRLAGQGTPSGPPAPPNPAATEAAYRQTLRRWFQLTTQGPAADREEIARVHQEILRLIDDVGEPSATTLRRQWAREWWQETSVCPYCGEPGHYYGAEQSGEGEVP